MLIAVGGLLVLALVAETRLAIRPAAAPAVPAHVDETYTAAVQPIFDRRCVVCHSCFDSPCQLNLQSFEGLDRGASPKPVYEPSRLEAIHPTRMFQDAATTAEWRARFNFFPVVARNETDGSPERSLLWRAVEQRRNFRGRVLVDIDRGTVCPHDMAAMDLELRSEPEKGMPYGFPPLDDREMQQIGDWIRRGAGGPESADRESDAARAEIGRWETFLNAPDIPSRIVARYLFEHLFLAHLAVPSAPGEWFRLVRSRTGAPTPIDEISTTRPYDDPKSPEVHYRLRRLRETVVEKTHAPYLLNDAKLAHLRHIFFDAGWRDPSPALPSYDPSIAANPFVAFKSIPAHSRYQFLLDDADYHIKTFIHGPVCKGQVALNVIDEHFLIFFLAPDADPAVTHPEFLPSMAENLGVPAEGGEGIEASYVRFKVRELSYLRDRATFVRDAHIAGHTMADIWNGEGANSDAVLTVYRHFDSASVVRGAVGGVPKTIWVLDYPILERMYYDLVAGFDVFGDLIHQTSTRRYMNLLRMEAESEFLSFLPISQRSAVRDSWYRPTGVSKVVDVLDPVYAKPETQIAYPDPERSKETFVMRLLDGELAPVVGAREPVQWNDVLITADDPASRFERAVRGIVSLPAPLARVFPDATLVRLRAGNGDDSVYTIVRNKAHFNVDFMFFENEERAPAEDTIHIVRGIVAGRPNLFLTVDVREVEGFAAAIRALTPDDASWFRFIDRYGVRRGDPGFWAASDFFNSWFLKKDPVNGGLLDLSRYSND